MTRTPAVVRVAKMPTLKPRAPKDEKKAQEPIAQKPLMKLTPEMLREGRGVKPEDFDRFLNAVMEQATISFAAWPLAA